MVSDEAAVTVNHMILCTYIHAALPTTREILDLTWNYRAKWKFIGIVLDIDVGTLDAIYGNNRKVEECLVDMIDHWLRNAKPRPTRDAMIMALKSRYVLSTEGNCHHIAIH